MLSSATGRLRLVGMLEGASFLLLLGVGMPLKYGLGLLSPIKFFGWAHGVLFIAYLLALTSASIERRWGILKTLKLLLSALIPFGPFVADRSLRLEEREEMNATAGHDQPS